MVAVLKTRRRASKAQYLLTAQKISEDIKEFALDVPARYYRVYVGRMVRCASKLCSHCMVINRIWSRDSSKAQYRFAYVYKAEALINDIEDEIEQCCHHLRKVSSQSQHYFNKCKRGITAKRLFAEFQTLIAKLAPELALERRCLDGVERDVRVNLKASGEYDAMDMEKAEEEALSFSFCPRVWKARDRKKRDGQETK